MVFLFISGCGSDQENEQLFGSSEGSEEQQTETASKPASSTSTYVPPKLASQTSTVRRGLTSVPISFAYRDSDSWFYLASATAFSISLDSCQSGYTSTANQGSTNLQVYTHDRGCLAKLTTFTYDGIAYTPKTGSTFSTWLAGDTAVFENTGQGVELTVRVVSQLSNQVIPADSVSYEFYDIDEGTTQSLLDVTIGTDGTLGAGTPPSFSVYSIELTSTDAATGAFDFVIILECTAAISGNSCQGVDMANIDYRLVQDTYSSAPSLVEAAALFPTGETSVDTGADVITAGTGGVTNGGFTTKSGASVLVSPNNIHSNPNMILVLESNDDTYQYFNLDVNVQLQN